MMRYIMKILKSNLMLLVVLLGSVWLFSKESLAQPCMSKEMRAEKVAFLTNFLELTPDESQVFWPLYNEMFEKRRNIHRQLKRNYRKIEELSDNTPEMELSALSDSILGLMENENKLLRQYNKQFVEIIGQKKSLQLYLAERNYRVYLMKKYRKGCGFKGQHRGGH